MNAVSLQPQDLVDLAALAKDLNLDDRERRAALLENNSRDFNAVPGSGKTSLLAVKLLLLAKKWPYARRGLCILSHTNVARDEIARRLAQTTEGAQLLTQYRIHEEGNELLKQTGKAGAASRGNLGAVIAAGWPDVDDASRPAL
ncbi:UvrD-helicase domain-containing protein [Cupriavidus gilardii]|uniref:UvrD-helicase domain-containing protein n=1 Tax=Cupriavidus gilardii TaxID=82541 RepID=UPI0021BEB512|nr:UvrD-helicase domain-containing protein [Cupriavidus gilardii]MCT9074871.1 UvrD-helicase domain-containing protein [Cupriavidus gilardii]